MRERCGRRGREGRGGLLDELCELCGYGRKHAIKLLGGKLPVVGETGRRGGPRRRYGEPERAVLKAIWLAAEQPCGKRLQAALALWLPHDEAEQGALEGALRERVLGPSAATIDRLLAPCRVALGSRGRCGTRPGTLLRQAIPVRTEHWDVAGPGWVEADTVAHCGESMAGDFVWSLTMTDVHTQWTETRSVWNKGQHGVQTRIAEVEKALPFVILGFDSDNGGEFLNWHLAAYFLGRQAPVAFTRSRPYRKNDNARVEQKNWTHVRQLVGYERMAEPAQEGERVSFRIRHTGVSWIRAYSSMSFAQGIGRAWVSRLTCPNCRASAIQRLGTAVRRRISKATASLRASPFFRLPSSPSSIPTMCKPSTKSRRTSATP